MPTWPDTLRALAQAAQDAGVFAAVRVAGDRLECEAKDAAAPAFYRVDVQPAAGRSAVCISLVTPDRWLSQSIEQELVHTGDKLEELVDEELAEQGYGGAGPRVEHYRSEDRLYTFRSPLAEGLTADAVAKHLLAYEAAFRHLGDMQGGDEG